MSDSAESTVWAKQLKEHNDLGKAIGHSLDDLADAIHGSDWRTAFMEGREITESLLLFLLRVNGRKEPEKRIERTVNPLLQACKGLIGDDLAYDYVDNLRLIFNRYVGHSVKRRKDLDEEALQALREEDLNEMSRKLVYVLDSLGSEYRGVVQSTAKRPEGEFAGLDLPAGSIERGLVILLLLIEAITEEDARVFASSCIRDKANRKAGAEDVVFERITREDPHGRLSVLPELAACRTKHLTDPGVYDQRLVKSAVGFILGRSQQYLESLFRTLTELLSSKHWSAATFRLVSCCLEQIHESSIDRKRYPYPVGAFLESLPYRCRHRIQESLSRVSLSSLYGLCEENGNLEHLADLVLVMRNLPCSTPVMEESLRVGRSIARTLLRGNRTEPEQERLLIFADLLSALQVQDGLCCFQFVQEQLQEGPLSDYLNELHNRLTGGIAGAIEIYALKELASEINLLMCRLLSTTVEVGPFLSSFSQLLQAYLHTPGIPEGLVEFIHRELEFARRYSILLQLHRRALLAPDVEINVSSKMGMIEIVDNDRGGRKREKYRNPVLLNECSCNVPESWRAKNWSQENCSLSLHRSDGPKAFRPFGHLTLVRYDNTKVFCTADVWPPAIDSLFMARVLKKRYAGKQTIRVMLDLGAGTGFLGIYLGRNIPSIEKVYFSDVSFSSALLTYYNIHENVDGDDLERFGHVYNGQGGRCYVSSGYNMMTRIGYDISNYVEEYGLLDLVVCCPPYLPKYSWLTHGDRSTTGTALMERALLEAPLFTKRLVLAVSSVSEPELQACREEMKGRLGVDVGEKLDMLEMPFRVPSALAHHPPRGSSVTPTPMEELQKMHERFKESELYREALLERNGLFEKQGANRGFRYWHRVSIYEFDFRSVRR